MTEKLKYKVGDKVLVEAEVIKVDSDRIPYRLKSSSGGFMGWYSEEVIKMSLNSLPPKPKIPQAVMDWAMRINKDGGLLHAMNVMYQTENHGIQDWFEESAVNQQALATLIAYGPEAVEVETEKIYRVKIKNLVTSDGKEQFLTHDIPKRKVFASRHGMNLKQTFTKRELVSLGFEGVFDNPMFEVEEVE